MNWRLLLSLSLVGFGMAVLSVFWNSPRLEQSAWLLITVLNAWLIAQNTDKLYFLHGFLLSIINTAWVVFMHLWMMTAYLAKHPDLVNKYADINSKIGSTYTQAIALTDSTIGIASGIITGLLAVAASRIRTAMQDE